MCHTCQVDDDRKLFRSRSFVIRYREEQHVRLDIHHASSLSQATFLLFQELNEGVFWRLTLPKVDLSTALMDASSSPQCEEILSMKFELLFAPLLERDGGREDGILLNDADMMTQIENFLPFNSPLEAVATQNIAIRRASSGVHEYIPVSESSTHF